MNWYKNFKLKTKSRSSSRYQRHVDDSLVSAPSLRKLNATSSQRLRLCASTGRRESEQRKRKSGAGYFAALKGFKAS